MDRSAFLNSDEGYEKERNELYREIRGTEFTGVSGYIAFGSGQEDEGDEGGEEGNRGNWLGGRMVQLVLAGAERYNEDTERGQRQHVIQRCGLRNADKPEEGEQCVPVELQRGD